MLSGEGDHFCAGLDLAEVSERSVAEGIVHSRSWHAAFEQIQFGRVPVVAVLHGAVVGGGLELAAPCHVRVAEASAFYGLPEGQRGLFVGGGGSARIPRLIGAARMTDMMLTGRVYDAEEGFAIGLSQYVVDDGSGAGQGVRARRAGSPRTRRSRTSPCMHALPRIADMAQAEGLFVESLMAAIASGDEAAKSRIRAFLEGRAAKVQGRRERGARRRWRRAALSRRRRSAARSRPISTRRADGSTLVRLDASRWRRIPSASPTACSHWADARPRPHARRQARAEGGDWRRVSYARGAASARARSPRRCSTAVSRPSGRS